MQEFPWTGIVSGYPIIAFWYWCTDQVIVQRVLAAKSVGHARSGSFSVTGALGRSSSRR
jgi:SSS family solute:Na+ symporter